MGASATTRATAPLAQAEKAAFARDGFVIVRDLAARNAIREMRRVTLAHLQDTIAPIEYEADVAYPGAPASREAEGGYTARRLLQAYDRHSVFRNWACNPDITATIAELLNSHKPHLTRCHHNCVMTKQPAFSSATAWHQDLRYWSFAKPELINVWLALGDETPENGCMRLVPGSHRMDIAPERLDEARFLREDRPENRELIDNAVSIELAAGDVLFFHAGAFHAAGRNGSDERKLSVVLTYHGADNHGLPGTRSARLDPVPVTAPV